MSAASVVPLSSSSDDSSSNFPSKSLLSDKAILEHIQKGTVLIEPFVMENLSTSSYDVTLGRYYFRESDPEAGAGIYNPVSRDDEGLRTRR